MEKEKIVERIEVSESKGNIGFSDATFGKTQGGVMPTNVEGRAVSETGANGKEQKGGEDSFTPKNSALKKWGGDVKNLADISLQNIIDYILAALNFVMLIFVVMYLCGVDNAATVFAGNAVLVLVSVNPVFSLFTKHRFTASILNFNLIALLLSVAASLLFAYFTKSASKNVVSGIFMCLIFVAWTAFFVTDIIFFKRSGKKDKMAGEHGNDCGIVQQSVGATSANGFKQVDNLTRIEKTKSIKPKSKQRLAEASLIIWLIVLFGIMLLAFSSVFFNGSTVASYFFENLEPLILLYVVIILAKLVNCLKVLGKFSGFTSVVAAVLLLLVGGTTLLTAALPNARRGNDLSFNAENYIAAFGDEFLTADGFNKKTDFSVMEYFMGGTLGEYKVKTEKDVKYFTQDGKSLYADAYYPVGAEGKRTVLIRMHGNNCDKGTLSMPYMNKYFASLGYAVFDIQYGSNSEKSKNGDSLHSSIDYTRTKVITDSGNIHEMVGFFAEFLNYLVANQDELNLDLGSVFLSGNSFGGYMTCTVGFNMTSGEYSDLFPEEVTLKGLIPIYPWLGPDSDDSIESPSSAVTENSPPMLMFMGGRDGYVGQQATYELALRYKNAGIPNNYAYIWGEYAAHSCDIYPGSAYSQSIIYYMERFMAKFK